jgi:hypothetical protein
MDPKDVVQGGGIRFGYSVTVNTSLSRSARIPFPGAWCPSEVDIHRGLRDVSVALIIHIRRCIDAYEYCA